MQYLTLLTRQLIIKARIQVDMGALSAMQYIMTHLGYSTTAFNDISPPGRDFTSLVNYVICTNESQDEKLLLEVKSPSILEHNLPTLESSGFHLLLQSGGPSDVRTINKVQLRCLTSLWSLITKCISLGYRVHEFA